MSSEARHRRLGSVLVTAQFALIGLCLAPVGPDVGPATMPALGIVCLASAAAVGVLALRAMGPDVRVHPVPHESAVLRTNGVYGHIRHPMYLSVLLGCLGVTLISGRLLAVASTLAMVIVLNLKARLEDRLLGEKFGPAYAEYARAVPSLLPRPWRSRRG